jgi:DNA-binding Lrp family transcriptional regulator
MIYANKLLNMEDLDEKIVLQLIEDGRQPISRIAKKVGVTRQTVAKKIESLKSSGTIKGFMAEIDPIKFGLKIKAYVFLKEDPDIALRKRNEEKIKEIKQIYRFYYLFGKYDVVLEILVQDNNELDNLIKKIHELEGVKETETFMVRDAIKNMPEDPIRFVLSCRFDEAESDFPSGNRSNNNIE